MTNTLTFSLENTPCNKTTNGKKELALEILKVSDLKLGGFSLQTLQDIIDDRPIDQDQLERFRLLAREFLYVVY